MTSTRSPDDRPPAHRPAATPTTHPRNRHQGRYDFGRLVQADPALAGHLVTTPRGEASVDFHDPVAVRALNRAILRADYGIAHWDLPDGALCPPIPGRADYLHGLADLLADTGDGRIPRGLSIRVLDVGVGASAIYPLLGHAEYGWRFVGADIDATSLQVAAAIIASNRLERAIALRRQPRRQHIFEGVVGADDRFDLTLCNPPFHASAADAAYAGDRKRRQLGSAATPVRGRPLRAASNFGGHAHELWCPGGEAGFLRTMVHESADIPDRVLWFSSLVSRAEHLSGLRRQLRQAGALDVREVPMAQGSKQSRFVAWTYLDAEARAAWCAARP